MKYTVESATYWEFAMGLWFPERARVTGPAPGVEPPGLFHADAVFELSMFSPHYELTDLRLHKVWPSGRVPMPGTGPEIDTERYRSLRLLELRSGLADELGVLTDELPGDVKKNSWLPQPLPELSEREVDLVKAARIYTRSKMSGRSQLKDVSNQMEISAATAGRWIRRARELGLMKSEGF